MKHHLLLFIMVFLFPFMACGDDELKEIYNPNLLRSTSIDDSSLHLAFPAIAGNKDRSKIIVVYREGSSHVSFDSKLIQMESFDKGKTWVNRKVIFAPVKGHDVRDPQLLDYLITVYFAVSLKRIGDGIHCEKHLFGVIGVFSMDRLFYFLFQKTRHLRQPVGIWL